MNPVSSELVKLRNIQRDTVTRDIKDKLNYDNDGPRTDIQIGQIEERNDKE